MVSSGSAKEPEQPCIASLVLADSTTRSGSDPDAAVRVITGDRLARLGRVRKEPVGRWLRAGDPAPRTRGARSAIDARVGFDSVRSQSGPPSARACAVAAASEFSVRSQGFGRNTRCREVYPLRCAKRSATS